MAHEDPAHWWRNAVIYQVYIRSFADGDGDGIGDIAGIRCRLPYLADLGVDALWINPWYPSPMADAGYDVADYRGVEPAVRHARRGRGADPRGARARACGSSSTSCPTTPRTSTPGSRRRWRRGRARRSGSATCSGPAGATDGELPPNDWQQRLRRPGLDAGHRARRDPGEWYLHLFAPEQPDLNWDHPEVRADFERPCGSGSTAASTASASTSRTRWSSRTACPDAGTWRPRSRSRSRRLRVRATTRSGTATSVHEIYRDVAEDRRLLRPAAGVRGRGVGARARSGSRATCAPTSCTPPSTSTSCSAPWDAGYAAAT